MSDMHQFVLLPEKPCCEDKTEHKADNTDGQENRGFVTPDLCCGHFFIYLFLV